jgi:integrase/recombinase XerC
MQAAVRSPSTRYLRDYQLRRFASEYGGEPWDVTTAELVSWIAGHTAWAAETKRGYRAALRSFYGWAHLMGSIPADPAGLLPAIKTPTRKARPTPEALLNAVLAIADPRIRLMVLLGARLGLRRGEIAQVHTRDLETDILGWSLRVHGKGAKERVVPLCDEIRVLLQSAPEGFLFPGQINGHLSPPYVGKLVSAAFEVGWTAHTLRHRFATVVHDGCHDLAAVQMLLGHSRSETTMGYIVVPTDSLRAAIRWAA